MNYIIIINIVNSQYNAKSIHDHIVKLPGLTDWWHYLPSAYIVSTTKSAKSIADFIIGSFPGLPFFIGKIDLSETNGILSKSAWDWITDKNKAGLRLRIAPSSGLPKTFGDLLPPITQNNNDEKVVQDLYTLLGIKK